MKTLAILAAGLLAIGLFLVDADLASADQWRGSGSGTSMQGRGRGTAMPVAQRAPAAQQRGRGMAGQRGAPVAQRGPARPARAGELDPLLAAGALGTLGLVTFGGGWALRRRTPALA